MVSSIRPGGYDPGVNVTMKRVFTIAAIVSGIFLVTVATVVILTRILAASEQPTFILALISGGIVAGLSLPVLIWLALKPVSLEQYSAFALEEIDLDEDDLTEAVGNWVYARYKRRMEDDARFLEDEDGNVTCRVTVRKD